MIEIGFYVNFRGVHGRKFGNVHSRKFAAAFTTWKDAVKDGQDAAMWSYLGNGRWHKHYASEHYPAAVKRPVGLD